MATRAQKIRLALFLLFSGALLAALVFLLAGLQFLEERHRYTIEFKDTSVGGLNIGSQVKYMGLRVGKVEEVAISREDLTSVRVEISVDPRLLPNAIRADTRASMANQGITGLKYIELVAGTQYAPVLPPGSRIQPNESFLSTIDERAEVLTAKVEQVLNNLIALTSEQNTAHLSGTLRGASELMQTASGIAAENRHQFQATFANLEATTQSLAASAANMQAASAELQRTLAGNEVQGALDNLHAASTQLRQQMEKPVPQLIANLNLMTTSMDRTFNHIDQTVVQSRDNILRSLQDLQETLQNVRQATDLVKEDPSVLIRGRGAN
ncbi:MAG: MCE family protein [Candidatus Handelsmanbacteria bacterium]|nr:MCE family protein [Candidatus Handelsmanbacteria bacterium]